MVDYNEPKTNPLHRTQPESSKFTFCSGLVLHRNQARSTFGDWLNGITELSRNLHSMELDMSAFSCLAALTLVNGKTKIYYFYELVFYIVCCIPNARNMSTVE